MLTDEMRYKLMRVLQESPYVSQRDLARQLDVSLGRVNYCLQALIRNGLVKAKNLSNSKNKVGYIYILTPRGIEQRANLAVKFLDTKTKEFESLRIEIERMRREVEQQSVSQ